MHLTLPVKMHFLIYIQKHMFLFKKQWDFTFGRNYYPQFLFHLNLLDSSFGRFSKNSVSSIYVCFLHEKEISLSLTVQTLSQLVGDIKFHKIFIQPNCLINTRSCFLISELGAASFLLVWLDLHAIELVVLLLFLFSLKNCWNLLIKIINAL